MTSMRCPARSLAVSLLERRPVPGTVGDIPSVREVVRGRQNWVGRTFGLFLFVMVCLPSLVPG